MSRILTNNSTAAKKKRDQSRANSTAAKPRKTMISLDEMKRLLVQIDDGQRKTLVAMTDQEFRDWLYNFIESISPFIKASDGVKILIEKTKNDVDLLTLNEETRMYLANNIYQTAAYRRSGIEIFVSQEVVA
jgi:hypothetical protein